MPKIPSLVEMLQAGMHFGHRTSRWHPKMKRYIFGARSGMHIINLEETQKQLEEALEFLKGIAARGGVVLFVGTKTQAKDLVKKHAESVGMPYVTERWLGGTLTNFKQIRETLKRFKMLKDQRDKGELRKYTKKEQLMLAREIAEMETKIGGIQNVTRVPEALFVVDVRTEKTAIAEANTINTKVVAMCDTNVNPTKVHKVIPANDDAVKSIEMVLKLVTDAIKEGKAGAAKVVANKAKIVIKK
jgi:small subunit ribosomal protein S2